MDWAETSVSLRRSSWAESSSIRDSSRTAITLEELCSLEFCFRFKSGAGESWTRMDPCAENTAQTRGYQQISAQSSMSRTRSRQA